MTTLPGIAGQIEALIGLDLTMKLLRERGGTGVMIPTRARGTVLAGIIGEEATETLIRELGHGPITLPCATLRGAGARRLVALEMLRQGASLREVALACDMHVRSVSRLRARLKDDDRQGKLPL